MFRFIAVTNAENSFFKTNNCYLDNSLFYAKIVDTQFEYKNGTDGGLHVTRVCVRYISIENGSYLFWKTTEGLEGH